MPIAQVKEENPGLSFLDLGRKLGEMWREMDPQVCAAAEAAGLKVKDGVEFYIQYGSGHVKSTAENNGWHALFGRVDTHA